MKPYREIPQVKSGNKCETKGLVTGRLIPKDLTNINITAYEYDEKGNLIKEVHPDGNTSFYLYDIFNHLVEEIVHDEERNTDFTTKFECDKNGNTLKRIMPNGEIWYFEYDDHNNRVKMISPSGDIEVEEYVYDDEDNMLRFSQKGFIQEWEYDQKGNVTKEITYEA